MKSEGVSPNKCTAIDQPLYMPKSLSPSLPPSLPPSFALSHFLSISQACIHASIYHRYIFPDRRDTFRSFLPLLSTLTLCVEMSRPPSPPKSVLHSRPDQMVNSIFFCRHLNTVLMTLNQFPKWCQILCVCVCVCVCYVHNRALTGRVARKGVHSPLGK